MGIKANYTIKVPNKTDFLSSIGVDKDSFITVNRGGTFAVLHDFGVKFAADLAKKLENDSNIDTGRLVESMTFQVRRYGMSFVWEFSMYDYYKFIDQDIKAGKFPWDKSKGNTPTSQGNVLYQWVKRNNYKLLGGDAPKDLVKNQLSLAYLIGRNRKLNGRKGSRFFTSTVKDGRIAKLSADLSKALKSDVIINIKEYVKELKKK